MRALIVEDDRKIASFVVTGLRQAGFAVDHARDGQAGLDLALAGAYDVDVVDLMLPKLDGLALIDALRRGGARTPVIILTAKRSVDARVKGLDAGGDDYLTKPFAFSELLARIHALLRRAHGLAAPTRLVVGDLTLDLLRREVRRGERSIDLQPREFALLECLMRHPGQPLSRALILRHVWNYDFDPQTNVVEVLVSRLRAKIDGDFDRKLLHTTRGIGYALETS